MRHLCVAVWCLLAVNSLAHGRNAESGDREAGAESQPDAREAAEAAAEAVPAEIPNLYPKELLQEVLELGDKSLRLEYSLRSGEEGYFLFELTDGELKVSHYRRNAYAKFGQGDGELTEVDFPVTFMLENAAKINSRYIVGRDTVTYALAKSLKTIRIQALPSKMVHFSVNSGIVHESEPLVAEVGESLVTTSTSTESGQNSYEIERKSEVSSIGTEIYHVRDQNGERHLLHVYDGQNKAAKEEHRALVKEHKEKISAGQAPSRILLASGANFFVEQADQELMAQLSCGGAF